MPAPSQSLRRIPAVERVLQQLGATGLPRPLVVQATRETLAGFRKSGEVPALPDILTVVRQRLAALERSRLQPVINATGVVLHTNLGRAPLGGHELAALRDACLHYTNLELDLDSGARGGRGTYGERCLALLCGAEAAAVVNNCAAALVLIVRQFTARRPEVVISRGELVQIGGGFRIPDILEASGARLREVGTTNRTRLGDFAQALGRETGMVLKVHRSNFFMEGFVASPTTAELAALARKHRVTLVEDLGSGALFDTATLPGLEHEPTPGEVLRAGADLVCFSGDKLLGGPQAGIIVGKRRLINALKKDPFFRALRCDKLILAALQATAERYLMPQLETVPPVRELLGVTLEALQKRGRKLLKKLTGLGATIRLVECRSQVGGGTLPRSAPASFALAVSSANFSAAELARRLRLGPWRVIANVARGAVWLDLRTVFPFEDGDLALALGEALAPMPATVSSP
jgi:L-seryl-tRNA(Ser) seleniumtransferase